MLWESSFYQNLTDDLSVCFVKCFDVVCGSHAVDGQNAFLFQRAELLEKYI